jgi:phasin
MAETTHAMPKTPEAFRQIAETSAAQTKEMCDKMKVAADETTGLLANTLKGATTGAAEYNRRVMENARLNVTVIFDFATALFGTKSLSEAIEVSTAHARKQFETVADQTKELSALFGVNPLSEAIEVSTAHVRKQFEAVADQAKELTAIAKTAEPVNADIGKELKKVA